MDHIHPLPFKIYDVYSQFSTSLITIAFNKTNYHAHILMVSRCWLQAMGNFIRFKTRGVKVDILREKFSEEEYKHSLFGS